jgi:hypothetical protein
MQWRTLTAVLLAFIAGIPAGMFGIASAVPFGPVLVGWFVILAGSVLVTAVLGLLASERAVFVGFCYSAAVASTIVISRVIERLKFEHSVEIWSVLAQFAVISLIVGTVSLIASLPILKAHK